MNRIDARIRARLESRSKILAMFLTAGYPRKGDTVDIVLALEKGGADIIELGMPFSDPLADGPVIQESSATALRNGVTLQSIFTDVVHIRRRSQIPIILMGYVNPIIHYGEQEFFDTAASSGVDGIILPEVPLEEFDRFAPAMERYGLAGILLVTPTTSPERIELIDQKSRGFLYCVSTTGVTGKKGGAPATEYLQTVREHARNNALLVGFGISTPEDARAYAWSADGVIVGSALIRFLSVPRAMNEIADWTAEFKAELHTVQGRS
jgi:tryptophan synthase alpha chain